MIQGFKVQSNVNGTCILKKKGYNTGLLIILLLLGILLGLLYYLLSNDETVMIRMVNSNNQINEINSYCKHCGAALPKNVHFCSKCGSKIESNSEAQQLEFEK